MIRSTLDAFREDDCMTLASAIAFAFLLSILPFLTLYLQLAIWIKGALGIGPLLPMGLVRPLVADLERLIPFVSAEWIETVLIASGSTSRFHLFNYLMLPFASGLIFHALERAYQKIFRLPPRPMLFRQLFPALFSIGVMLFLFLANLFFQGTAQLLPEVLSVLARAGLSEMRVPSLPLLPLLGIDLLSLATLSLFFLVTVRIFLKERVTRKNCIRACTLFVCLWALAKAAFSAYLSAMPMVNLVYGSLSSLIILLLWIFYSAAALLLSIEFLYVLHLRSATAHRL